MFELPDSDAIGWKAYGIFFCSSNSNDGPQRDLSKPCGISATLLNCSSCQIGWTGACIHKHILPVPRSMEPQLPTAVTPTPRSTPVSPKAVAKTGRSINNVLGQCHRLLSSLQNVGQSSPLWPLAAAAGVGCVCSFKWFW